MSAYVLSDQMGACFAEAPQMTYRRIDPNVPAVLYVDCYYFPKINLGSVQVFAHLGGQSLSLWLEGCSIKTEDTLISGCRFMHARSNVSMGRPTVSAVLVGKPIFDGRDVEGTEWRSYIPSIYARFTQSL